MLEPTAHTYTNVDTAASLLTRTPARELRGAAGCAVALAGQRERVHLFDANGGARVR